MKRPSILQFSLFLLVFGIHRELSAGGWTTPKGTLWLKSAFFYQSTDRRFCSAQDALSLAFHEAGCTTAGDRAPFDPFSGGESRAATIFLDAAYGLTDRFEISLQLPFYSLQFTNSADPDRPASLSVGDVRIGVKYQFLTKPFAASVKTTLKAPTGKFTIDAEVVNVSEGQFDYEFLVEAGKSLWPFRGYVNIGAGYRWRGDNERFEHILGDEFIATAEFGFNVHKNVMLKSAFEWMQGERPKRRVAPDTRFLWRRELLTVSPTLIVSTSSKTRIEGGVRFTLTGQDFPAGPQFGAGVSHDFSLR